VLDSRFFVWGVFGKFIFVRLSLRVEKQPRGEQRQNVDRWVAPVARFGATGVASPQEVTNLADRNQD
jgi:hypothetical protein